MRCTVPLLLMLASAACQGGKSDHGGAGGDGGGAGGPASHCPPGERELADGSCLAAGVQETGCEAGELANASGDCVPAGLRPEHCGEGFVHDGDVGCDPVLPTAACGDGTWAIAGDTGCRDFLSCGAGPWPDTPAGAAVLYVDGTANGQQDGSASKPYDAIQKAVDAATDGTVIAIAQGSYAGSVTVSDKAVALIGRCGAMVELVATGEPALTFAAGSTGSTASALAVTGDGHGVVVNDSDAIVLDGLWLHDLSGHGVHAERLSAPTAVMLRQSLIDRVTGRGVYAIGAAISVEEAAIRDMQTNASQMGRAIDSDLQPVTDIRCVIDVRRAHIERAAEGAIMVYASTASIRDSLIRDTLPRPDARFGRGINAQSNDVDLLSELDVSGSIVDGAYDGGIVAGSAQLTLHGVVVRNVDVNQDAGIRGYGVAANTTPFGPTVVTMTHCLVENAHESGIFNLGSEMDLTSLVVRHNQPVMGALNPDLPPAFAGRGMTVQSEHLQQKAAATIMRGSVVTQNHEAGVAVFGSALTLEGSAITDQLELDGAFGRGVAVLANRADLWPSTATIVASVLSGNVEVGLSVVGSHVDAVGLLVERTAHTAQGALGAGVSVEIDAASFIRGTANISDSVITDSFTSGVLAFAADVSLSHSLVANVEPAPTEGGIFGDGLTILNLGGQPTFVVSNSAIVAAARAGAASFGGLMDVERTLFDCAAIDLAVEPFGGVPAVIRDLGGNVCGCATGPDAGETHACKALSATLSPPDPPPAL